MLEGCDWWISIRSVDNTQDWRKFWKRFRGYFVFQSRVSTKTVVNRDICPIILAVSFCIVTQIASGSGVTPGGGGGTPRKIGQGCAARFPKTPTLFVTKICDIPYPIYDLN